MATLTNLFKTLSLTQIKDVNITSPSNNQILQYDSATSKWKNVTNLSISPPTYDFASSDTTNGAFKVTVTNADTTKTTNHISIRGLGSAAYENISKFVIASTATGKTGYAANSIAADKLNNPFEITINTKDTAFCSFTGDNTVTLDIKSGDGISLTSKDTSFTIALDTTKVPVLNNDVIAADAGKYLQYTATGWQLSTVTAGSTSTTLSAATESALGGIQIGFTLDAANKKYPVELDTNKKAYVTVSWTDTDTKYDVVADSGLSLTGTTFSLNTAKVPVLPTTSTTSGYVYWEAATPTTSGSWKLNALTGGSTYTAGNGIDITSNNIAVKLNNPLTVNIPTGIYTTNSGLTLETAGLRINQTVTPVLNTTVSNNSGYVYWEAATPTTSGSWKLNTPTVSGGSTYTAGNGIDITSNAVSVSAGAGLAIDSTSKKLIVDDSIIAKRYFLDISDTTKDSAYSSNNVSFNSVYTTATGDITISCNLTKYPSSIILINKLNNALIITKIPIITLTPTLSIKIPGVSPSSYGSGIIISMVI